MMMMEEFSEEQRENAVKFVKSFLSLKDERDRDHLISSRPRFTLEELEGECLHVARRFLSSKGCPGILSYHISHHAVQKVASGDMDKLLFQEPCEGGEEGGGGGEEEGKALSAELVAESLLTALEDVCQKWAESLPVLTQVPGSIDLSLHAIKNTRRKMEDRHAVCVDINSLFGLQDYPPQSFYGVFDGHVAVDAAEYTSVHLLPNIVQHPDFKTDPISALKGGILTTDQRFCKTNQKAGTTAVMTLLRGSTLYVAWVGDSQAMLFRRGQGVELVNPHKPDRDDERERIEGLGGLVIWLGTWRVNGNLSVSRAIGDGKDKKFITAEADTNVVELDGSEDFLVVACDGVWDVLNSAEMSEEVTKHFTSGGKKHTLAHALIAAAKREGSGDNMTVIILYFPTFQTPNISQQDTSPQDATDEPGGGTN